MDLEAEHGMTGPREMREVKLTAALQYQRDLLAHETKATMPGKVPHGIKERHFTNPMAPSFDRARASNRMPQSANMVSPKKKLALAN